MVNDSPLADTFWALPIISSIKWPRNFCWVNPSATWEAHGGSSICGLMPICTNTSAMGFLHTAITMGHCWGLWASRGWISNVRAPQLWQSHHSSSWDRCKREPDRPILLNILQWSFQGSSGLDALRRWRIQIPTHLPSCRWYTQQG